MKHVFSHRFYLILAASILLSSCQKLTPYLDSNYSDKVNTTDGSDHLKIVFSHNINGETHPCGCRKFPLGGLKEVSAQINKLKKTSPILYLDSGDMLFQTTSIPFAFKESMTFSANKLAEAQKIIGLKLLTPGDLDLSLGLKYLADLTQKNDITLLTSNLIANISNKKSWITIKTPGKRLYFIGVTNPQTLMPEQRKLFSAPMSSIKKSLSEVSEHFKSKISNNKNIQKKVILVGHNGIEFDKKVANTFSEIDWIIGSHSQSFLRTPLEIKNTKIVQVLSRNHYLGVLKVPYNVDKEITYEVVEVRDNLVWKENPLNTWIVNYKNTLDSLQKKEGEKLVSSESDVFDQHKGPTFRACTDCHTKQADFWKGTSHALAFHTLLQSKASNNPECIKCHSVFFRKAQGFSSKKNILLTDEAKELESEKLDLYWSELTSHIGKRSVRSLTHSERVVISNKREKLDNKLGVAHNFSHVQCLNCHDQGSEHPFDDQNTELKKADSHAIIHKCMECHNADQSPSWYSLDTKGLATELKKDYVLQKIKAIACPKIER